MGEGSQGKGGQHGEQPPDREHNVLVIARDVKDGPEGTAGAGYTQVDGILLQRK